MDLGLRGRAALVGGSSRGLGYAVARELAAEGCRVVLCARDAGAVAEASTRIAHETGAETLAVYADLSVPEQVEAVVARATDRFGSIDVLVTNTGGPPPGAFESHSAAAWRAAIAQNLESVVNLTRLVLPGMKQRGWGRIVNITSIAVKQPVDGLILSNSIRAAVTGFGRTLANELAPLGITVNTVAPGFVPVERHADVPAVVREAYTATVPAGRMGTAEEIAHAVSFFASDEAGFVTGQHLVVDGGRSLT